MFLMNPTYLLLPPSGTLGIKPFGTASEPAVSHTHSLQTPNYSTRDEHNVVLSVPRAPPPFPTTKRRHDTTTVELYSLLIRRVYHIPSIPPIDIPPVDQSFQWHFRQAVLVNMKGSGNCSLNMTSHQGQTLSETSSRAQGPLKGWYCQSRCWRSH